MEKSLHLQRMVRDGLALVGVFALGWMLHGGIVHAAADDVQFQLQEVHPNSTLLVYQPSDKTIYVYQGATIGNSSLQCSYLYRMEEPGGVIRRENCAIHSMK
jgi:hypothetical protein